jgi:hypothetical protein
LPPRGTWQEVETGIERRSAPGYDRAFGLLSDLLDLAEMDGTRQDFDDRLASIRQRHDKKGRFIGRLAKLGVPPSGRLL